MKRKLIVNYNKLKNKYGVPVENDIMMTAIGTIGNCHIVKKNEKLYFKKCLNDNYYLHRIRLALSVLNMSLLWRVICGKVYKKLELGLGFFLILGYLEKKIAIFIIENVENPCFASEY